MASTYRNACHTPNLSNFFSNFVFIDGLSFHANFDEVKRASFPYHVKKHVEKVNVVGFCWSSEDKRSAWKMPPKWPSSTEIESVVAISNEFIFIGHVT